MLNYLAELISQSLASLALKPTLTASATARAGLAFAMGNNELIKDSTDLASVVN